MAQYISPGDAFTTALLEQEQAQQQQQAAATRLGMDQQRLQIDKAREDRMQSFQQSEIQQRDEALRRQREEADVRATDKKIAGFEKRVGDMFKGDIPDALLIKTADEIGQGHLFPPDPMTGHRTYVGSRREREDQKQRDDAMAFAQTLPPDSVQRKELEFFSKTGKTAPAGTFKDTTGGIRVNFNPRTGAYTAPGSTTPITDQSVLGGAKVERLTEPNPMAEEAATERRGQHLDNVRKEAYSEYDKWLAPVNDQIAASEGAGIALHQNSAQADAVLAPMMLKAFIVSGGRASGVRMTQAEILNYTGGATKWEQLKSAVNQWSADPQHFRFTESQRKAMQDLLTAYTDRAYDLQDKANTIRRRITRAKSAEEVDNARDELDEILHNRPSVGSLRTGQDTRPAKGRKVEDFLPGVKD